MKRQMPSMQNTAYLLFAVFLFILLLVNADVAMDGVQRGLLLCAQTLIPSLFPFLVLSELLVASGAGTTLGRLFSRPVASLFGVSRGGGVAILLGCVCGFPVATTTAVALCEKEEISQKEAVRISLFANNPSSGFLISAVGEALFGNRGAGVALFFITLLSATLVGILLRLVFGKANNKNSTPISVPKHFSPTDFTSSVKRAFSSLLSVCAFVMFFAAVTECLGHLSAHFSLSPLFSVFLSGALELTGGISTAATSLSPALAFRVAAFLASFSGLCVALQIFAAAENIPLHFSAYLLAKLVQGAIALLLTELYLYLFRPAFVVAESVGAMGSHIHLATASHLVPWVLLFILLLLHLIFKRRQKA